MELPAMGPRREAELAPTISSLEEDEMQIAELTEIEESYRSEVASHTKRLLEQFGEMFKVESFAEVFVTPEGKIALMDGKKMIAEIAMESLPGPLLAKVLIQIMPEVKRLLVEQRQGLTKSSALLEKSAREFRKVTAALPATSEKKAPEVGNMRVQPSDSRVAVQTGDAIKVALSGKEK